MAWEWHLHGLSDVFALEPPGESILNQSGVPLKPLFAKMYNY